MIDVALAILAVIGAITIGAIVLFAAAVTVCALSRDYPNWRFEEPALRRSTLIPFPRPLDVNPLPPGEWSECADCGYTWTVTLTACQKCGSGHTLHHGTYRFIGGRYDDEPAPPAASEGDGAPSRRSSSSAGASPRQEE